MGNTVVCDKLRLMLRMTIKDGVDGGTVSSGFIKPRRLGISVVVLQSWEEEEGCVGRNSAPLLS